MAPALLNALDVVAGMAKSKAKRDEKPAVNDAGLDDAVSTYIARKAEAETAAALCEAAKEQIVSAVRPERLSACVRARKVISSVSVNGRLTFMVTSRYSPVPEERKDALREAFGDDFDRYFADTLAIGLTPQAANSQDVLTTLLDKLGAEFFAANFAVRRDLLVREPFHHDYCTVPAVQDRAEPFLADQTIRPYSPSLKVQ